MMFECFLMRQLLFLWAASYMSCFDETDCTKSAEYGIVMKSAVDKGWKYGTETGNRYTGFCKNH